MSRVGALPTCMPKIISADELTRRLRFTNTERERAEAHAKLVDVCKRMRGLRIRKVYAHMPALLDEMQGILARLERLM